RVNRMSVNRFHVAAFLTWQFISFFGVTNLFPIFSNYVPRWKCGDGEIGKDCAEYKRCGGNVTFTDVAFDSAALEFRWICDDAPSAALSSQTQFFGILTGTLSFGLLSDAYGRKWVTSFAMALGLAATTATGFLQHVPLIFAARFFIGLSIGGLKVVGYTFIMEMILPDQRMFLRAVFNWGISRMLLTAVAYCTQEWRAASFGITLLTSPALFALLFIFPESPTWLHSKGRLDEMRTCERRIARLSGVEYAPVKHSKPEKSKSLLQVLRSGALRRLLVLYIMWFTAAVSSYATDLVSSDITGNLYLHQFLFGAALYASKIVLGIVDARVPSFTRRVLHQCSQFFAVICFGILAVFSLIGYNGPLFLLFNVIGIVFIEYTWDACYLCAVES
ncbi:hypothetical protein PFISCL1PPCAC_911, partial [Pristionchus fissidentatus]